MNPYMNEDVAWQRLKDLQREVENSRLMAAGQPSAAFQALGKLAAGARHLADLVVRRSARRRPDTAAQSSLVISSWRLRSPNR